MSLLSAGLAFFKADLAVDEIPVLANSIAIYQKSPNALGKAAAVQNLIANAPVAALEAEADTVQELLTASTNALQAWLAQEQAAKTAAAAALTGTASAPAASSSTPASTPPG